MAKEVFIPKLGQTVEEVTIVKWLVPDGSRVEQGQEIVEVETDKAMFTVEATAKGFLHIGPYPEGTVVPVLTVVALIGKQEERFEAEAEAKAEAEAEAEAEVEAEAERVLSLTSTLTLTSTSTSSIPVSPRARKLAAEQGIDLTRAAITPTGGGGARIAERDVLAYLQAAETRGQAAGVSGQEPALAEAARPIAGNITPVARRMAEEAGLDWQTLVGTGPRGQVTKEDVEQAIAKRSELAKAVPSVPAIPSPAVPLPPAEVAERIPLKGVRTIIAERMGTSVHTTARVTLVTEADATELVALRERLKARVAEAWGFAPGYNDLLARIVAVALRRFPYMNARLAADAIELMARVNLGMAVDTERGLLVPVIRDADKKNLREFGAEFRALVERARAGRALPDDLTGGTFTMTNLGMYDIDAFTPVINLPEAAILGVGRISPKWVYSPASPTAPVLRQMLTLSLVFDHRLVDGAPAARFLQYIKQLIEEPFLLLAEI
ncbi:MAG: dihydrolipoamide acetyltransferase family protein [Anaerolineae bacterium]